MTNALKAYQCVKGLHVRMDEMKKKKHKRVIHLIIPSDTVEYVEKLSCKILNLVIASGGLLNILHIFLVMIYNFTTQ